METENTQRELDLIDLIKICWGWFVKFICKPCFFLFKFAIKKWWVILISAIVGFAISYCISTYNPKYLGNVIYENNVGSSSDYVNSIRLLSRTTPEYMSEVLGIPIEEAIDIIGIAPHAIYYRDTLQTSYFVDMNDDASMEYVAHQNRFAIEIKAYSKNAFEHLQDGFIRYYSNNPFFSKQMESRIKELDSSSKLAKDEAEKLDGLRVKGSSSKGVMLSGGDLQPLMDPAAISREVVRLNELSVSTTNALEYNTDVVTVVSPLMVNKLPENFFVFTYKKWIAICVVVGLLLALCLSYRKKVYEVINGK